ncbi:hypothetical protein AA80_06505 [Petrotoga sibirica DSM 13575]|uniref:Uncharacterized protein n=1 Tax=Petrotoga sibirica DSM 13575 TaxID=1122956 RepID=A0A855MQG8_9BACT|nr:hypothetical protein AA80_06505 [Petrotoga sibirica DSM 13575]
MKNVHLVDCENAFVKSKKNVWVEGKGIILKTSIYNLTNFFALIHRKVYHPIAQILYNKFEQKILQGETPRRGFKEGDREGTIQLYKIFVF